MSTKNNLGLNYDYSKPCHIFCPCTCYSCCCCRCCCPTYCNHCCCYYPCHCSFCPICYKYLKDKYLKKDDNTDNKNQEDPSKEEEANNNNNNSIFKKYRSKLPPSKKQQQEPEPEQVQEDQQPNEEENKEPNNQKFNDYLTKVMQAEKELEDKKKILSFHPDFNCEDCFRLFEKYGLDSISKYDVNQGLNKLCMFPPRKDVDLFMKKNDLLKRGKIGFEEFCDIVTPFEKNIRDDVFERKPNDMSSNEANLNDSTKDCLKDLLNRIIDLEKDLNEDRKNLGEVDLEGIFECFKNGKDLSHDEFIKYLQDNGLFNDIKEAELLFVRLDKNRDGKIQQREIKDEITPVY